MDAEKRVEQIYDDLVDIRRDLHKNPELSKKEFRTQKKIQEYLNSWEIDNKTCADTGVVAIIKGKSGGRTVGVRADIDALPITEKNKKIYASVNEGVMHACGHDAHTTILLGVARIMKEMSQTENSFNGNVKLFFQPAEEGSGGAKRMIEEGCMENPKVDNVIGLHVMPYIDAGTVELKYNKLNASTDSIRITLKGQSTHAAYPDNGVDAIAMAGSVITSIQTIVSRNISPLNSVVISLSKISGGVKDNVMADEVKISGTLRTLDDETRSYTKKRITDMTENIAKAYGGECSVSFIEGYKALINNDEVVDVIKENAVSLLGKENVFFKEYPSMGAEDFSYFLDEAKGAFYHLGCGSKEKGITSLIHTDTFDIDEECLKVGVKLQIKNILSLLGDRP